MAPGLHGNAHRHVTALERANVGMHNVDAISRGSSPVVPCYNFNVLISKFPEKRNENLAVHQHAAHEHSFAANAHRRAQDEHTTTMNRHIAHALANPNVANLVAAQEHRTHAIMHQGHAGIHEALVLLTPRCRCRCPRVL